LSCKKKLRLDSYDVQWIYSSRSKIIISIILPAILSVIVLIILSFSGLDSNYWGIFLNIAMLAGCFLVIRIYKLNRQDLGLKLQKERLAFHIFAVGLIFIGSFILNFVFIGVTSLKPITFDTYYYLVNYLIVAIMEELYSRGIVYHSLENKSEVTALLGSSIVFGLFHIRQGIRGIISKVFIGFGWGSVRYTSSMIFLLFLFHYWINYKDEIFVFNVMDANLQIWLSAYLYLFIGILIIGINYFLKKKKLKSEITSNRN